MLSGFAKRGSALQSSPFELFSTDSNYLNYKYSLTCYLFSDRIWRVRFASARSRPHNRQRTISFTFFLSANCKPSTANPFSFNLFRTLCTNQTLRKRRISLVFNLLRTLAKTMGDGGYSSFNQPGCTPLAYPACPGQSRGGALSARGPRTWLGTRVLLLVALYG